VHRADFQHKRANNSYPHRSRVIIWIPSTFDFWILIKALHNDGGNPTPFIDDEGAKPLRQQGTEFTTPFINDKGVKPSRQRGTTEFSLLLLFTFS
jgi:hypothetical protein